MKAFTLFLFSTTLFLAGRSQAAGVNSLELLNKYKIAGSYTGFNASGRCIVTISFLGNSQQIVSSIFNNNAQVLVDGNQNPFEFQFKQGMLFMESGYSNTTKYYRLKLGLENISRKLTEVEGSIRIAFVQHAFTCYNLQLIKKSN